MFFLFECHGSRHGKDGRAEDWKDKLFLLQEMRDKSAQTGPRPEELQVGAAEAIKRILKTRWRNCDEIQK